MSRLKNFTVMRIKTSKHRICIFFLKDLDPNPDCRKVLGGRGGYVFIYMGATL